MHEIKVGLRFESNHLHSSVNLFVCVEVLRPSQPYGVM